VSFYVLIRGPLGAGKTTIPEQLSAALGGRHLAIDVILEKYHLEEWDQDYISERSFLRANEIAAAEAEDLIRTGTPAVIDGNYYYRSVVEDLERRLAFPHLVVTLKVPLSVCVTRDAGRTPSYGEEAAREVFQKTTEFDCGHVVDAARPVEEVLRDVISELHLRGLVGA